MRNIVIQLIRTSTLLITLVILFSCAPTAPFELQLNDKIPASEKLVIGRISVLLSGQPVENWGSFSLNRLLKVFLLRKGESSEVRYVLKGDGAFQWKLQPGKYVITGFEWQIGSSETNGRIWAEFEIPNDENAGHYVGTLVIDMRGRQTGMRVEDNRQSDMQKFAAQFPEFKYKNFTTTLMQLESAP